MIYAIAAYSITLGTLAFYGVFLHHHRRAFSRAHAELVTASAPPNGFNLGAALLSPFWLWGHGLRWPGVTLLALCAAIPPLWDRQMWIPLLVVSMVPFAAGAALGFVGNRIAAGHRNPESVAEFSASQLPWAIAGIGLYTIVLPWVWYFVFASV